MRRQKVSSGNALLSDLTKNPAGTAVTIPLAFVPEQNALGVAAAFGDKDRGDPTKPPEPKVVTLGAAAPPTSAVITNPGKSRDPEVNNDYAKETPKQEHEHQEGAEDPVEAAKATGAGAGAGGGAAKAPSVDNFDGDDLFEGVVDEAGEEVKEDGRPTKTKEDYYKAINHAYRIGRTNPEDPTGINNDQWLAIDNALEGAPEGGGELASVFSEALGAAGVAAGAAEGGPIGAVMAAEVTKPVQKVAEEAVHGVEDVVGAVGDAVGLGGDEHKEEEGDKPGAGKVGFGSRFLSPAAAKEMIGPQNGASMGVRADPHVRELRPFLPMAPGDVFMDNADDKQYKSMNLALFDSIIRDPATGGPNQNPIQYGNVLMESWRFDGNNVVLPRKLPGGSLNMGALPSETERIVPDPKTIEQIGTAMRSRKAKRKRVTRTDEVEHKRRMAAATAMGMHRKDPAWVNNNGAPRSAYVNAHANNTMPIEKNEWEHQTQTNGSMPLQPWIEPAQGLSLDTQLGSKPVMSKPTAPQARNVPTFQTPALNGRAHGNGWF